MLYICCTNINEFNALESIHSTAARVIYNPNARHALCRCNIRKILSGTIYSAHISWKYTATLICNIYHHTTSSCLEHLSQRKESKYNLSHHHCVSVKRFEIIHKNFISCRRPIVWILLEPSTAASEIMLKWQKSLPPSENWTLVKSHRKWVPKLTWFGLYLFYSYLFAFLIFYYPINFLHGLISICSFKAAEHSFWYLCFIYVFR